MYRKDDKAVVCNPKKFCHEKIYVGSNNPVQTMRPVMVDFKEPETDNVRASFSSSSQLIAQLSTIPSINEDANAT